VKIVLAVDEASNFEKPEDLPQNCEVATEYVQLVQRFFANIGRSDIKVVPSFGNTEHKIGFGATAIVDVTESGESLKENHLKVIHEIMQSSIVVVANPESLADESRRQCIDCFARLINGAFQASNYVMIAANVPQKVVGQAGRIMNGMKGASLSVINDKWFALQSIILKTEEINVIFDLLKIGVTDIAVTRDIPLIMNNDLKRGE
jgi:ATP phosphoribosyltransferase